MRAFALLLLSTLAISSGVAQNLTAPRPPAPQPLLVVGGAARPVALEEATVTVEPAGGMVRTTLEMRFRNPNDRVLEGNLQFPLGPGQQVVGFALDVNGRMREAVAVEKERGRQIFEAIEREGVDPGLLEQTQGEFFRLRIYPFPAGGERTVRIDVVEPLKPHARGSATSLPLAFAAELAYVNLKVRSAGAPTLSGALVPIDLTSDPAGGYGQVLRRGDFSPERGLTLVFPEVRAPVALTQAHGDARYFVMDVPVTVESRRRALPARAALVWDSSHSGAGRSHDLEFALLDRYFAAARQVEVDLIRLRDTAEPTRRFVVRDGDWAALRRELEATVYDGATSADFVVDPKAGDVLLFGDGLFNYGRGGFPTLAPAQRLYAVQAAAGDGARLAALAHGHRGQLIRLDGRGQLEEAAAALLDDSTRLDSIDATGATDLAWESPVPVDGRLRIAGRLREADPRLQLRLSGPAGAKTLEVRLPDAVEGRMAGWLWARYSLARLQGDPGRHRAAMQQLGTEFNLVTPQTSLIVLERPEDYVRHAVPAPDDLRAEVAALMRERDRSAAQEKKSRLDKVAEAWAERIAWWEMSFPKGKRPEAKVPAGFGPPPPPAPAAVAAASAPSARRTAAPPAASSELDRVSVTGSRIRRADIEGEEEAGPATRPASIRLQPWVPDSAVARRLRGGASEDVYRLYLDERSRAPQGTAFYLDVADILFEKKQPELALRVLSNLAEMQLEDRHILRVLAYRLLQAKRADLAVPLLERVREIGGEEPQSYRDLGLAYAELGDHQKAVEQLYEVVIRPWDTRFTDIEMASLAELNALVATAGQRLDTSRIDPRLMRNLPVGLRAVLSWDSDNSDMDLHVTDPNGEEAYYSNPLTYQGGRMSDDFTGGYGPEEFALREPAPGRYRIEVVYFGDQQQIVTGATTLQLWLSTGFGTRKQKDQKVTLRLADRKERIFVGEFEVH